MATTETLAAILRGDEAIPPMRSDWAALVETCVAEDLLGLLYARIQHRAESELLPQELVARVMAIVRESDARELLRQREVRCALDALAAAGVLPVLLKGTPLAYSIYPTPASRPRRDSDLLIRREDVTRVKRTMAAQGYTAALQCDGDLLLCQFALSRTDRFGLKHAFDFHWKISTQSVFGDVLTFEEAARDAVKVEALGSHARTVSHLHALLIACIHPVMHHRNIEHLLWVYDVHLLASRLSVEDFDRFAELANEKGVAAIAAHQLERARFRFGTVVPDRVMRRLETTQMEGSASYLSDGRRWHHELRANLGALRSWKDRCRLLREVVFPTPKYMRQRYGVTSGWVAVVILPGLYLVRVAFGIGKMLRGRK